MQEVVLTGDDVDLTKLPVHLQHGNDGAPYISAGDRFRARSDDRLDQCRHAPAHAARPRETGIDLVAPSDLRTIYLGDARRAASGCR